MRLVGASPDDLDDIEPSEVTVADRKADRAAAEAAAAGEARRLAGALRAALAKFYEELRKR